jgi:hypothetical protein
MNAAERFDEENSNAQLKINEKGDKCIIAFWKDKTLIINRYNLDVKGKRVSKEIELKPVKD